MTGSKENFPVPTEAKLNRGATDESQVSLALQYFCELLPVWLTVTAWPAGMTVYAVASASESDN